MSRIHEALKKAEQERATGRRPEGSPEVIQYRPPQQIVRDADAKNLPVPNFESTEDTPTGLTYEDLVARCSRPHWYPDSDKMLFVGSADRGYGTEEFRTLRSRLYQVRNTQPMRRLLVTSALPGEGKTFTAANLALAIVRQADRRTLLIDADLRLPALHKTLGAPMTPGLSDYLRGTTNEFSVIQKSPRSNLFFVPGGNPVSNPAELIGHRQLRTFLDRVTPLFDWIIVDSPPVVPISDACLLADLCDGVLMVVHASSTPFDMAQKACQELRGKPLLGVVLNGVKPGSSYSAYYYNHYAPGGSVGRGK